MKLLKNIFEIPLGIIRCIKTVLYGVRITRRAGRKLGPDATVREIQILAGRYHINDIEKEYKVKLLTVQKDHALFFNELNIEVTKLNLEKKSEIEDFIRGYTRATEAEKSDFK